MLSSNKKLQIGGAFATLLVFALGVGCNGFFVNPTLTGITVGPTTSIQTGSTVQMTAVATYNDGSTQTLGSGVYWSSSDPNTATVSTSGLVKGISSGSATITASYQTQSGTATITVNLGSVTALRIQPTTASISHIAGSVSTPGFQALATVQGQSSPVDVSATATWSVSDTTDYEITQQGVTPVTVTALSSATAGQRITVTAVYQSTSQLTATATVTSN
jgi:hypothetical protein